jgi:hypothetical protein
LLFHDPTFIIFTGRIDNNYDTFKLDLHSAPVAGLTTQTAKYKEEDSGFKSNAIIQDGLTSSPGYIVGGKYNNNSKEGLVIWRMDTSFNPTWEVFTDP